MLRRRCRCGRNKPLRRRRRCSSRHGAPPLQLHCTASAQGSGHGRGASAGGDKGSSPTTWRCEEDLRGPGSSCSVFVGDATINERSTGTRGGRRKERAPRLAGQTGALLARRLRACHHAFGRSGKLVSPAWSQLSARRGSAAPTVPACLHPAWCRHRRPAGLSYRQSAAAKMFSMQQAELATLPVVGATPRRLAGGSARLVPAHTKRSNVRVSIWHAAMRFCGSGCGSGGGTGGRFCQRPCWLLIDQRRVFSVQITAHAAPESSSNGISSSNGGAAAAGEASISAAAPASAAAALAAAAAATSASASASDCWDHEEDYDVIVVGAGHAGCEAALAAARLGAKTLLLTLNLDRIAWQPCNPAVGGPAKSQLVHEVDALGGEIGKMADSWWVQQRAGWGGGRGDGRCSRVGLPWWRAGAWWGAAGGGGGHRQSAPSVPLPPACISIACPPVAPPATRRSLLPPRPAPPAAAATSKSGCSTAARAPLCGRCARRPTSWSMQRSCGRCWRRRPTCTSARVSTRRSCWLLGWREGGGRPERRSGQCCSRCAGRGLRSAPLQQRGREGREGGVALAVGAGPASHASLPPSCCLQAWSHPSRLAPTTTFVG